jgi:hypothetical protein
MMPRRRKVQEMSNRAVVLEEPRLEFRHGQFLEDPHDGLSLFGPYGVDVSAHPKNLTIGVIGTKQGIAAFNQWCKVVRGAVYPGEGLNTHLWPVFPGFEAAFCSDLPREAAWSCELDSEKLKQESMQRDPNKRAAGVVEQYLTAIEKTEKKDETFGVLVCVVPDFVWKNCRPESYVPGATGEGVSRKERELRAGGQTDFFNSYNPSIYQYSVDFRRQLKARSMQFGIPIQIIRECRLEVDPTKWPRFQSPPSDVAWNLLTTMYYKSGGKPWRLAGAREGVCYIGIVFRRTDMTVGNRTACCAAQMFLDSGDGVVFLGEYGPWYSPQKNQFHLTPEAAKQLLGGVLETYRELEGQPLKEIFLHCRSSIYRDEFEGYRAACPTGVKFVGIRVRKDFGGLRLFREGTRHVVRGTFLKAGPKLGYLWASGFIPRLRTYPGWESPVPLKIDIQHGEAEIEQVARDVLALTKLNYNACRFGDSEPVTIGFSNAVGEILVSNPTVTKRSPKFKFYI